MSTCKAFLFLLIFIFGQNSSADDKISYDLNGLRSFKAVKSQSIAAADAAKCVESYELFKKSYGDRFLQKKLKKVVFAREILLNDRAVDGLADEPQKVIYIVCNPRFSQDWVLRTLHHEFFSVYYYPYRNSRLVFFDKASWKNLHLSKEKSYAFNDQSSDEYYTHSFELWSRELNHKQLERGFLSDYSSVSFQQDISVFAEFYFTDRQLLGQLAEFNPDIDLKLTIFEAFLQKIKWQQESEGNGSESLFKGFVREILGR